MVESPALRLATEKGRTRGGGAAAGSFAAMMLKELWLDTLVLGVDALSPTQGAMCFHEGEAGINALMVERSDRVVAVATGEKVGIRAFARICPVSRIDMLVTDRSADPGAVAELRAAGVTVETV